jgi:hypothetical protein
MLVHNLYNIIQIIVQLCYVHIEFDQREIQKLFDGAVVEISKLLLFLSEIYVSLSI